MTRSFPGRTLLMMAVLLLAATVCHKSFADAVESARAHVREQLASKAPGFSIAVGQAGRILWAEGFGWADIAAHQPVTRRTQFRIGSVSKPLTAVGLMLLVQQGRVDLDADIHKYVPSFPDKAALITTRELAGHLAGIRHYRDHEFFSDQHYNSMRAGLKVFENDPLLFKPGEKFSYSSYGYNLISAVMESRADESFADYMHQSVFLPLEMTNTVPDGAQDKLPQCTRFYVTGAARTNFVIAPMVDNGYKLASGGFLSTPEDMVRFGSALLHPGLLSQASLDAMFTSQKTVAGEKTGYGIGWFIRSDRHGHRVWSHSGGSVGGAADLLIYPDTGLVIAIAANYGDALDGARDSIQRIADDFTGPGR
jgi:serine beta-lactamase-like protein LACTB, mitochondrial